MNIDNLTQQARRKGKLTSSYQHKMFIAQRFFLRKTTVIAKQAKPTNRAILDEQPLF
jgi:hypothetical protein